MTTGQYIWYYVSALILAAALFRPVRNLIVAGKVRGFEKKRKRPATEEDVAQMKRKSIPLVVVITVTFSLLFTKTLVMKLFVGN